MSPMSRISEAFKFNNVSSSASSEKKTRIDLGRMINKYEKYRKKNSTVFITRHSNEGITGVLITKTGKSDLYRIAR